jgi:hypothetical protein
MVVALIVEEETVIRLEEPVFTKGIAVETTVAKAAAKTKTTVVSLEETATLVPPECTTARTYIHC